MTIRYKAVFNFLVVFLLSFMVATDVFANKRLICGLESAIADADTVAIVTIRSVDKTDIKPDRTGSLAVAYDMQVSFKGTVRGGSLKTISIDRDDSWSPYDYLKVGDSYLVFLASNSPVACSDPISFDMVSIDNTRRSLRQTATADAVVEALFQRFESGVPGFSPALWALYYSGKFRQLGSKSPLKARLIKACEEYFAKHKTDNATGSSAIQANDLNSVKMFLEKFHKDEEEFQKALDHADVLLSKYDISAAKSILEDLLKHDPRNALLIKRLEAVQAEERKALIPNCPIASSDDGHLFMRSYACNTEGGAIECPSLAFPPESDKRGVTSASMTVQVEISPSGKIIPNSIHLARSSGYPWFDSWMGKQLQSNCSFKRRKDGAENIPAEVEVKYDPNWRSRSPHKKALKKSD